MSSKPTILCVDDQPSNLRIRAMLLEQFGCVAKTAPDGQSALRIVTSDLIDLIVIDYHLAHGESGEDVARDVRVIRPRLPIIMLTGDTKLPQSACEAVDEVLIKGASNPTALFDLIQKLLPNAELRPRRPVLIEELPDGSGTPQKSSKAS
jgi:two-component system, OmpR family, response regulator